MGEKNVGVLGGMSIPARKRNEQLFPAEVATHVSTAFSHT